ncbi:MAG: hypothetical protein DCC67_14250 [Planctomycetota bacterium]|nr:MAG: hypothetical protein DCC67_14250 [Planctomycetota bacterium]
MAMLTENPLPIILIGGVAATAALVFFLARRTSGPLMALAAILGLSAALLAVERLVVTDREEVEQSIAELFAAIEANDVQRTLRQVDPNSSVPADVRALMPLIHVEKARTMGSQGIQVHLDQEPPTAVSSGKVALTGTHASSGAPVGYVNQRVEITWTKPGDRWMVSGYTAFYEGRPIDAVDSARANQAQ